MNEDELRQAAPGDHINLGEVMTEVLEDAESRSAQPWAIDWWSCSRCEVRRFEELCRLAREEPLFPGQADAGLDDRFRVVPASDGPALGPDAARWTPEDDA